MKAFFFSIWVCASLRSLLRGLGKKEVNYMENIISRMQLGGKFILKKGPVIFYLTK